jgi:hypothetical protein
VTEISSNEVQREDSKYHGVLFVALRFGNWLKRARANTTKRYDEISSSKFQLQAAPNNEIELSVLTVSARKLNT